MEFSISEEVLLLAVSSFRPDEAWGAAPTVARQRLL